MGGEGSLATQSHKEFEMIDIKKWCLEHDISMRGLANAAGISEGLLRHVAAGNGCSRKAAENIAKAMGVNVDDIWFERENRLLKPTPNGHPVRDWRIANGVSLNKAATAIGITRAALCAIESRRAKPSATTVAKIHLATGIPISVLLVAHETE